MDVSGAVQIWGGNNYPLPNTGLYLVCLTVWFVLKVSRPLMAPGGRETPVSVYSHSKISFVIYTDFQIFFLFAWWYCVYSPCVCVAVAGFSLFFALWTTFLSKALPTLLIYDARLHSSDPSEKPIRCSQRYIYCVHTHGSLSFHGTSGRSLR